MTAERLYGLTDAARIIGLSPSGLHNRIVRKGYAATGLPEPTYCYASRGRSGKGPLREAPLWTRAQIEEVIAERAAYAETVLGDPA